MAACSEDNVDEAFADLHYLPEDFPVKRKTCLRCRRPIPVCICSCLPYEPIPIKTTVIILQHHNEESRCLATVPILQQSLPKEKLHIMRGKRFKVDRYPQLKKAIQSSSTLLLYPGKSAVDMQSIAPCPIGEYDDGALIVLDGTWAETKSIFIQNQFLNSVKQVELCHEINSKYIIRTQPSQHSLSTLESVAHALAWLEQTPGIVDALVRPLIELCQHQLDHGAVQHYSKDHPEYMPRSIFKQKQEKKISVHNQQSKV